MPDPSPLVLTQHDDITVVSFANPVALDAYHIGAIARDLIKLVEKDGRRKIILDLASIKILSSQTIGTFIHLRQKLEPLNGALALAGIDPKLYRVFKVTKLDSTFNFYPDTPSALAALKSHPMS